MYRLTVIAGPSRGMTFPIREGDNSVGRQAGNVILLASARVSKKHCVVHLHAGEVMVSDSGSANGTFVNGSLTRSRKLKSGDRISIGDCVLELATGQSRSVALARSPGVSGQVIPFPGGGARTSHPPAPLGSLSLESASATSGPPKDLKGKLIWFVDEQIMPHFYGLMLRYEWKDVAAAALGLFLILNLVISIFPMIEAGKQTVIFESKKRAGFMARQIIEKNAAAIAARAETKADLGSIPRESGVKVALLTDIEGRIIAPASRMNSYLTSGLEARVAIEARNRFRAGAESGVTSSDADGMVVAVEPLKVLNAARGMNEVVAMSIVSIDSSLATPDLGEMGLTYGQTLILTGLLGGLIGLILYRMTLKPFQILNDDMDKVLKGEMSQVTQEFKVSELDSLWDVINSAIQRVSRASGSGMDGGSGSVFGGGGASGADEVSSGLRMVAQISKYGVIVLDGERKIIHLNSHFEEISGIRMDEALGRDLPSVARDQAFAALSDDLMNRASPGSEGVVEDFEFSGVGFKISVAAFGHLGSSPKAYLFCVVKGES